MLGAEVTFDVAIPKVIWGWLVSTNMWAKSIATGSFMLALIATRTYQDNRAFFKVSGVFLGLIFIALTLLAYIFLSTFYIGSNIGSLGCIRFCSGSDNSFLGFN